MIQAVIGIDPSLTSAGLAVLRLRDGVVTGETIRVRPPGKLTGHERMDAQRNAIISEIRALGIQWQDLLIVIERAIPQRQAFALENLGLWWLITHTLWANGVEYAQVMANSAKKYITGNGHAEKDEIMVALFKRFQALAQAITNNDTADAMVFAIMGADRVGWPIPHVPKDQRKSLATGIWPEGIPYAEDPDPSASTA